MFVFQLCQWSVAYKKTPKSRKYIRESFYGTSVEKRCSALSAFGFRRHTVLQSRKTRCSCTGATAIARASFACIPPFYPNYIARDYLSTYLPLPLPTSRDVSHNTKIVHSEWSYKASPGRYRRALRAIVGGRGGLARRGRNDERSLAEGGGSLRIHQRNCGNQARLARTTFRDPISPGVPRLPWPPPPPPISCIFLPSLISCKCSKYDRGCNVVRPPPPFNHRSRIRSIFAGKFVSATIRYVRKYVDIRNSFCFIGKMVRAHRACVSTSIEKRIIVSTFFKKTKSWLYFFLTLKIPARYSYVLTIEIPEIDAAKKKKRKGKKTTVR